MLQAVQECKTTAVHLINPKLSHGCTHVSCALPMHIYLHALHSQKPRPCSCSKGHLALLKELATFNPNSRGFKPILCFLGCLQLTTSHSHPHHCLSFCPLSPLCPIGLALRLPGDQRRSKRTNNRHHQEDHYGVSRWAMFRNMDQVL